MKKSLAIFDWDGTLADSSRWAHRAMCAIFNHYHATPPPFGVFLEEISSDFLAFYRKYGIPPTATRGDLNVIWDRYLLEHPDGLTLRDGAREALMFCREIGANTAIVSGTSPGTMAHGLDRFGIGHLIDHVEADAQGKVNELRRVLGRFAVEPSRAMYVDDSREGIAAAKAVGVIATGVVGGFEPRSRLQEAEPDHLIASLDELLPLLRDGAE